MTESNLSIGSINHNIKPLDTDKQSEKGNATSFLKQDAQPDTVEINGDVKTLDKADKKKKKNFKLETPQIIAATGAVIALTGIGLGVAKAIKRGKIHFGGIRKPFSHEPLMPQMPTLKELDAHIADKVKGVTLDYWCRFYVSKACRKRFGI